MSKWKQEDIKQLLFRPQEELPVDVLMGSSLLQVLKVSKTLPEDNNDRDNDMGWINSYASGTKFNQVPELIKDIAHHLKLEVELDIHSRWFTETVYFKVYGTRKELKLFMNILKRSYGVSEDE